MKNCTSRMIQCGALLAFAVGLAVPVSHAEDLVLDRDTTLDPKHTYGKIVVTASNITVDGKGAWLIGGKEGEPKSFQGVAVHA